MMLSRRDFSLFAGFSVLSLTGCSTIGTAYEGRAQTDGSGVLREAMAGHSVPGMAAVLIRDFRIQSEFCAGVRALGSKAAIAPGDRWHLGSNGKSMTATLIARLVDAGVLSWERTLAEMLSDLAPTMHPAYQEVALPDLLAHRAGLPENTSDIEFFLAFNTDTEPATAQRMRYIARCLQDAPVVPLRSDSSYSNTGYLIAAACAERLTGRSFEYLIAAHLFEPLGIQSISFDQFGGPNEPQGHVEGRIADQLSDANPRMFAPAGAMRMTMADWARYCIDQMKGEHGGGRLLREQTYQFVHAPQGDTRVALGWGAAPHPMGLRGPALTHSGSDGNWFALVCLFPETGSGVLVAANAGESMGGDQAATAALRSFAQMIAEPWEG